MDKLKNSAWQHPVLFSILVILLAGVLTELPFEQVFFQFMEPQLAEYTAGTIEQVLVGLFLMALIDKLSLMEKAGFRAPARWRDLWLAWPILALTLVNAEELLTGALVIDTNQPARIALFGLLMLSVGFIEEIFGRSLVLGLLLRKWGGSRRGIYLAVIISSLLFGLSHLFNLLMSRATPGAVLTQVTYSFFFGVMFAACFLRLKSIWPVMLLHALFDFAGGLEEIAVGGGLPQAAQAVTMQDALSSILVTAPVFLWALWILRRVEPEGPGPRAGWQQGTLETQPS